jgi:cytochrome P450
VRFGDVLVPKGEPVLVTLAAADRDPERFTDPDAFDIHRPENPHIAFGYGVHYCLGASLARMEGQIAIGTLLRRLPHLRLAIDPGQLVWRPGVVIRGVQHLPISFRPA